MLWQKDANNIYVNICKEDLDKKIFEKANEFLGFQKSPAKSNLHSVKCRTFGNSFYATKQWLKAIESYNGSLCFAEIGAVESISLAYANRSACFLQLKMYDECLADIQLAIQSKYPEKLMPKLEKRKAICLEQIGRNDRSATIGAELSFESNENFSCMANVLQIKHTDEFGRHITAKSDIGVGKIVLKENATLSIGDKYRRCDTCWKSNVNLIPCTKCTSVLFCPGQCEQNQFHNIQCGMRIVDDDYVNDQQMNLLRSILMAICEFSSIENLMNFVEAAIESDPAEIPTSLSDNKSKYRAFLKLKFDHKTTVKETSFPFQIYYVYKALMNHHVIEPKISSKKYSRFLMHLIGHHLCIIQCNTGALMYNSRSRFNISKAMSENLSILVNYLNHSCAPNVIIVSVSNFNICITLRPIKNGDQLFVSYFRNDPMKLSKVDRRKYLQDICDFHCNCERCTLSTMPKELEEMKSDACYEYLRWNGSKINGCTEFGRHARVLRLCSCKKITDPDTKMMLKKCMEFLNKYGQTTWTTELDFVVKIYEKALKHQFEQL